MSCVIQAGLATVVMFEYHEKWPKEHSLAAVVDWMSAVGGGSGGGGGDGGAASVSYVCYLEGKHLLLRLTGCWDRALEMRRWSNVWCLHAVHAAPVVAAFDAYSLAFV